MSRAPERLNTAVILTAQMSKARQAKNRAKYIAGISLRPFAGIYRLSKNGANIAI